MDERRAKARRAYVRARADDGVAGRSVQIDDVVRVLRSPIEPAELRELIHTLVQVHSLCRSHGLESAAARVSALALLVGEEAAEGFADAVADRLDREWSQERDDG